MNSKRLGRLLVYWLPLLLGSFVLFRYSAGASGQYEVSWKLLQRMILYLTPDMPYQLDKGSGLVLTWSMYQLNNAFRRLAHIVLYAVMTFLLVRAVQQGQSRLKPLSILVAILGSAAYIVADELKRSHDEVLRHAKPVDIVLNAIGVVLILGGTFLFFGLKALERRLADNKPVDPPTTRAEAEPALPVG